MPAKKSTPNRVRTFLNAYAACGSVKTAAETAGISRGLHYQKLERDASYRKSFEALQDQIGQELEDLAVERVRNGFKRQQFWRGKPMKHKSGHLVYEVVFDTQLHITLLKRFRPKLYREHIVQEHTGSVNLVERLEAARARLIAMKKEEDDKAAS